MHIKAGFGVIVLKNCDGNDDSSAEVVETLYGPVSTKPNMPGFLGAEYGSNNSAELTAIGNRRTHTHIHTYIHTYIRINIYNQ